ncbi:hypothetical protein MNBD_GAMMA24-898 [hydrothermal vent metagenome]|uniref:Protochlamydia outer membrane protein domain-containing protein n=1 Tax=hydrothermal vent metagenome TaxID=652676 RepID=A0A3B1BUU6_9ZZZZ
MVKLSKLVLSFLFALCILPPPVFAAAENTRAAWPFFWSTDKDTLKPVNLLRGKEILAMLLPAATGENNPPPISILTTDIDKRVKTETRSSAPGPGSENPLKASRLELFTGTSLMNLGYTEFGSDGAWYDGEMGMLPGLLLGGTVYWPNGYLALELNTYFGDVGYRGQTQSFKSPSLSGLPVNSRSDANIFDTTAIAGYRFSALTLYGGFGYYFWRRNIRPTTLNTGLPVAGMLEFYSWSYALLGTNIPMLSIRGSHIHLDVRAMRMLQANMDVNFLGYGGYDNARLNLGEDWGLRLALPWTFRSSSNGPTITIEPWYSRWNLNRSDAVELITNGTYTGSVVQEPQSETRNFGISIYFRFLI